MVIFLEKFALFIVWPFKYALKQYPLCVGSLAGIMGTLVYVKLLYFPELCWIELAINAINHFIMKCDKLTGYVPPLPPEPTGILKLYNLSKKIFVWSFVLGIVGYSSLFIVSLSFGFNKLLLIHILPYFSFGTYQQLLLKGQVVIAEYICFQWF